LLSTVIVDAADSLRTVAIDDLGVSLINWDSNMATAQTESMVEAAGLSAFMFPATGTADGYHFNQGPGWSTQPDVPSFAQFVDAVGGAGMVTVDYGSGSPQEAAALMAYLDGSPSDTTVIGNGEEWNPNTSTWSTVNWQTVGYWAGLRTATPLGTDDGYNFLRVGQSSSFNIQFFAVGNEEYGSWEPDYHGQGGDLGTAHDPATYANFVMQFANYANEIDPTASIGVDANGPSLTDFGNWLQNLLTIFASNSYTPGFISDQMSAETPGSESDSYLLNDTVSDLSQSGGDPTDWVQRSDLYESDLITYLGATNAAKVELLNSQYGTVGYNPGKQTTSLVSGLWLADSLGQLMGTAYDGAYFYDLRGYWDSTANNSSSLYGWRDGGDNGLIGSSGTAPESGAYIAYPVYYAEELASKIVQTGGDVVAVSSNDPLLDAYAVVESNGDLELLVVNKNPSANATEQFDLTGFTPNGSAEVWQYGEAQDTAQSLSTDGSSSLDNFATTVSVSGNNFSYTFPQYSMTVIDLSPASAAPPPLPTGTVTVNAGQTIRETQPQDLGANLVEWDSALTTSQSEQMVLAAGLNLFRLPGGSASDNFHFDDPPAYNGQGTAESMATFVDSVSGNGIVTLNYGTGSPQEAAAFLAYLNGSTTDNTVIGNGEEYDTANSTWVTVDWQTVSYWASLRAAAPLGVDDGLNFLRADHPASLNITYFEVGNEVYGSWETDYHGSGGDTGAPHDPTTYANFVLQFASLAQEIDPNISIGIDAPSPDLTDYGGWLGGVLTVLAANHFTPGFLSDHVYEQSGGSESDSYLLNDTVSDTSQSGADPTDWAQRAADYESDLTTYLGATDAAKVRLLNTELNSTGSPGKQTTSLVNGLWLADSIGAIMETAYDGSVFWDLRNGWQTTGNNSSSLYGWREGGDFGMIGTSGSAPDTGTYIAYPTYYAEELASKFDVAGGAVVAASNTDSLVDVYAVAEADGHLDLLVINKNPNADVTEQIDLNQFSTSGAAEVWQYGEAQDTAQSHSASGASSLKDFDTALTVTDDSFDFTFPAYSMTVIDLTPGIAPMAPIAAEPTTTGGTTTNLIATVPNGGSSLKYFWSVVSAPAGVRLPSFSANGTNAAKNITATFFGAGTYVFAAVTVNPSNQYTVLGRVTVTVNQTFTSIAVTPASPVIGQNTNLQLTAVADDQFGHPMQTQPTISWTLQGGSDGSLSSSGLYMSPAANGSATVLASAGLVQGSATITTSDTAPTKLVIAEQSLVGVTNSTLIPGIVVAVEDQNGYVVTGGASNITLQLASDPPDGALDGTLTVATVNGLAVFNDIAFTGAGNYTVSAADSDTWLTDATTANIEVFAGTVRKFLMNGTPVSLASVAFQQLRVLQAASPAAAVLAQHANAALLNEKPLISELSAAAPFSNAQIGASESLSPAFTAAAVNKLLDSGESLLTD
jgi:alpha-L-arabinofuranosidase